jgi:uncharacterized protein YbjT (DUF2867 family)
MSTYLVAGVSGHTGSVVAQSLLDQKQKVRVLVRDAAKGERWKKRGAEVVVASVEDAHALGAAFRGADAAYLLIPPPPYSATGVRARSRRIVDALAQTVGGSHLKHVVFLSGLGADVPDGTGIIQGLYTAEQLLSALQIPITFLRAGAFVENWTSALEPAKGGHLPTFYEADFKYPQVGTHDIGLVAAGLLTEHPKSHRVIELSGPLETSPKDVATALSNLLGSPVAVKSLPVAQMASALQGFGFSAEMAGLFQEMTEAVASGRVKFRHPETMRRGTETLEQTLGTLLRKASG